MHHAVLVALIVFGVAVAAGLAAAAAQGLAAWRAIRQLNRSVGAKLAEMGRLLAELESRSAHAAERAAELNRARERLQAALGVAAVLTGGAGEAWSLVRAARGLMPRK